MWKTRVCDLLNIKYPIIEGGMTIAGNAELAAAVSEAGALGMIGSNPGWAPIDEREQNLRSHIRKAKSLTTRPFGVNITLFAMEELAERLIDAAIEERVPVIVTSGGSPRRCVKRIKDGGATAVHVVGNVRQAKSAEDVGVDMVVAEGYEAGGVNCPDELTTFVLVPYVVDAVSIPVVAAGGIADARGFVAALALGAEGIQMGSRFLMTNECHVHRNCKEAILAAKDTDTIITRRLLGAPTRNLKNDCASRLHEMEQRGMVTEMKAFIGFGKAREAQMLGDISNGEVNVGQNAGMIRQVLTAREVVQMILDGSSPVLDQCLKLRG